MPITVDTDQIIAIAAQRAADEVIDNERLFESVTNKINERLDKLWSERLKAAVSAQVDNAIKEGFDYEFRAVDTFGKPTGEPTTIRKRLDQMVRDYWEQTVDQSGKATARTSYGTNMTRAEWVMMQICGEDFSKTLKQEVVNVTAGLKDGLRAELRGWVDRSLGELFHVRSADDKAEGRNV